MEAVVVEGQCWSGDRGDGGGGGWRRVTQEQIYSTAGTFPCSGAPCTHAIQLCYAAQFSRRKALAGTHARNQPRSKVDKPQDRKAAKMEAFKVSFKVVDGVNVQVRFWVWLGADEEVVDSL